MKLWQMLSVSTQWRRKSSQSNVIDFYQQDMVLLMSTLCWGKCLMLIRKRNGWRNLLPSIAPWDNIVHSYWLFKHFLANLYPLTGLRLSPAPRRHIVKDIYI